MKNSYAGELPRRKYTAFRTRRKFENKNKDNLLVLGFPNILQGSRAACDEVYRNLPPQPTN